MSVLSECSSHKGHPLTSQLLFYGLLDLTSPTVDEEHFLLGNLAGILHLSMVITSLMCKN